MRVNKLDRILLETRYVTCNGITATHCFADVPGGKVRIECGTTVIDRATLETGKWKGQRTLKVGELVIVFWPLGAF